MSDWKIRFGTAGTSDSFAAQGYKSSLDVPEYTAKMGLNAFEYQCGRGVRLGLDKAAKMAALAAPKDILFSVHAPYYISMSSLEEEKRLNSIQYLLQSAAVCKALGGRRIIFHSGSCGKQSREAALEKALDTMRRAVEALDEAGFADMTLCPETMGKIGQLGTLDEVLALCRVDRRIPPCIDFVVCFLSMSLRAYKVPEDEIHRVLAFMTELDIRAVAQQVMHQLFNALAMRFEFTL